MQVSDPFDRARGDGGVMAGTAGGSRTPVAAGRSAAAPGTAERSPPAMQVPAATDEGAAARRRLAVVVAAAFAALTLPRLLAHELWRDEAWLWLVATQAGTPQELAGPLARSGQGYLFPLLCFLVARLSTSTVALQLLHLAIASAGAFAFVRWAPFPLPARLLFVLGYYPFYEYAVISRHYALGALLLWVACAAATAPRPRPVLLGAALGLLCQTTVYGVLLAAATAVGWLVRLARGAERPRPGPAVAGAALALAGAGAGVAQLVPLPGTSFATGWLLRWDADHASRVLAGVFRAVVPLPPPRVQLWNAHALDPWPALQAAGGVLVLALAVALLWRRPAGLATFALGGAGLLAFSYVKYLGVLRHQGHWWLLGAAALWLASRPVAALDATAARRRGWRAWTLGALLAVHCAAAAAASAVDLRHPFSNGPAAAALLRRTGLERLPLLGWREPPAAAVALALGRPLYAPSRGVWATHPDWGPLQRELAPEQVRCVARELAARQRSDVVVVANRPLPGWEECEPAGAVVGAIVATEDYHLCRLRLDRLEASAAAAACPGRDAARPPG